MSIARKGLIDRREKVRDAKLFIIATEGTVTEKQYFVGLFGSNRIKIEVLDAGPSGESAPNQVLQRLSDFERKYDLNEDDERWMVIDVDHHRPEHLKPICQMARQKEYNLAVSNPCFEVWLALHFQDELPVCTKCHEVEALIKTLLGSYNKTNLNIVLYTNESIVRAIDRAAKLHVDVNEIWPTGVGTHVYRLVRKLLPHLKSGQHLVT